MGLTSSLLIKLNARQTGTNDFGGPDFSPELEKLFQFASGTGADQADILYADEVAFTSSTAVELDLYGVLTQAFGSIINAAEVVAIVIVNESRAGVRNTVTLAVGAGTAPWFGMFGATGDIIKVPPGGALAAVAPDAAGYGPVTATTADKLTITPGAAAGAFQIAILARTA